MKKQAIFCLKGICMIVLFWRTSFAHAETHGTITGTTNYVWRMYSKSNNGPAIQGNLDYQHSSGFYGGVSISSFNMGKSSWDHEVFPNSAQLEITPYVGWSYKFADDLRADFQYSRYFYNGSIYGLNADYNEFYLFLHYKDLLSLQVSYIDDYYGLGKDSLFYELTGRYPLTDFLEFSSSFGYAQTKNAVNADYYYWNVGLTGRYKFMALDLRYHDSDEIYYVVDYGKNMHPYSPNPLQPVAVFSISIGF
jgi:uncharacterized protein (TIGR02001 family)